MKRRLAALAVLAALIALLCACQATVTVTGKYHIYNLYYVCTGHGIPCTRNTTFRVPENVYEQAHVGGSASISIPAGY